MRRHMLALLLLGRGRRNLIVNAQGTNASSTLLKYPLPSFDMLLVVLEEGLELVSFQQQMETVTESHLGAVLLPQLPKTGQLGFDSFDSVDIQSQILKTGPPPKTEYKDGLPRVLLQMGFQGTCNFRPHDAAPALNASYVENAMNNLATLAFTDDGYWQLVGRCQADNILNVIKGLQIQIGDIPNATDAATDPTKSPAAGGGLSAGAIAGIVIACVVFVVAAVLFYFYYLKEKLEARKKEKKRNRFKKKKSESKIAQMLSSRTLSMGSKRNLSSRSLSGKNLSGSSRSLAEGDEGWLDEWAQQVTSIPLTKPSSSLKVKQNRALALSGALPRPSMQSKRLNSLDMITEENEISENEEREESEGYEEDLEDGYRGGRYRIESALGAYSGSDDEFVLDEDEVVFDVHEGDTMDMNSDDDDDDDSYFGEMLGANMVVV